jgi:hypothetical protein
MGATGSWQLETWRIFKVGGSVANKTANPPYQKRFT